MARAARRAAALDDRVAMIAVLWANDAWYCVTWIAGEMKSPQRDLPRALLYGILQLQNKIWRTNTIAR